MLMWLLEREEISPSGVGEALEHDSGLRRLAGSADMREVLGARRQGEAPARLALAIYVHRLRAAVAAMAAALGGAGRAGVHRRRRRALRRRARAGRSSGLGFLGVAIDAGRNDSAQSESGESGRCCDGRDASDSRARGSRDRRQVRSALASGSNSGLRIAKPLRQAGDTTAAGGARRRKIQRRSSSAPHTMNG